MSAQPLPLIEEGDKFARCCVEHNRVLSVAIRKLGDGDEEVFVCPAGHQLRRFEAWHVVDMERNAVLAVVDINGAILMSGALLEPARPHEMTALSLPALGKDYGD